LLNKIFYLLGFLKLSSFESLANAFDQLTGCPHSQIGLEKKTFQLIQKLLIDGLFPKENLIHLFDKPLMGFRKTLF
jgi:hypothetical protein